MATKPAHADRAFEPNSKAGTDDPASRSHMPGTGHDERGRYGKSVPDLDIRDGGPETQPSPHHK